MNELENDFGKELAEIAGQFHRLMQVAAKRGFLAGSQRQEHRELLAEIKQLAEATRLIVDAPTSQESVDVMTATYRNLMQRVFDAMVLETDKAN